MTSSASTSRGTGAEGGAETQMTSATSSSTVSSAPTPAAYAEARRTRPSVIGEEGGLSEEERRNYPIYLQGEVQKGFGRGGKELGCATGQFRIPQQALALVYEV